MAAGQEWKVRSRCANRLCSVSPVGDFVVFGMGAVLHTVAHLGTTSWAFVALALLGEVG